MDHSKTGHFHNHPESSDLKLQIEDEEENSYQGNEGGEILAVVAYLKEIGLRLATVFPSNFPHMRQNVKSNHIHQWRVAEYVQNGSTFGVRPATGPEECERSVDLSGHEHPDQQQAETSTADNPLFEIHLSARSRIKTKKRACCDDGGNYGQ